MGSVCKWLLADSFYLAADCLQTPWCSGMDCLFNYLQQFVIKYVPGSVRAEIGKVGPLSLWELDAP